MKTTKDWNNAFNSLMTKWCVPAILITKYRAGMHKRGYTIKRLIELKDERPGLL